MRCSQANTILGTVLLVVSLGWVTERWHSRKKASELIRIEKIWSPMDERISWAWVWDDLKSEDNQSEVFQEDMVCIKLAWAIDFLYDFRSTIRFAVPDGKDVIDYARILVELAGCDDPTETRDFLRRMILPDSEVTDAAFIEEYPACNFPHLIARQSQEYQEFDEFLMRVFDKR